MNITKHSVKMVKYQNDKVDPEMPLHHRYAWIFNKFSSSVFMLCLFIINPIFLSSAHAPATLKIGLLIHDKADTHLIHAAQMAVDAHNKTAGRQPAELVTRSCDGPWGVGSKKAVELLSDLKIPILVGALDGRNAHLAEQVAAKSHAVFLSTQASDPTLSRAYVPWFYRIVPDDRQQSKALLEDIYLQKKYRRVAVVAFDTYDGKTSAGTFTQLVKEKGLSAPEIINVLPKDGFPPSLTGTSWDAIVLAGSGSHVPTALQGIVSKNQSSALYAFLNLFNFSPPIGSETLRKMHYVVPTGWDNAKWTAFSTQYQRQYDKVPMPSMAYVYDGMQLALAAVNKLGNNQEALKDGFKTVSMTGISGPLEFDDHGNRKMDWRIRP